MRHELLLTHEGQLERSIAAERSPDTDMALGSTGRSVLFDLVPTLHRSDAFVLPFYHNCFLGPVRKLLVSLWHGDPSTGQGIHLNVSHRDMQLLESGFLLNNDFTRPYESLEKCKVFRIEDTVRFLETFSKFLFNDTVMGCKTLSVDARRAWGYLRRGLMHHLRYSTGCEQVGKRKQAQKELLEFAKICEEVRPLQKCNSKMNVDEITEFFLSTAENTCLMHGEYSLDDL
jgi:hypothetical protein